VNREKILSYIENPEEISEEDISMIEELVSGYPYWQVGHLYLAKIAHDHNRPDKILKLNKAALHTINRAVLKRIIEKGWDGLSKEEDPNQVATTSPENNVQDSPADAHSENHGHEETQSSIESKPVQGVPEAGGEIETKTVENESPEKAPDQYSDVTNQIIKAIEENRQLREKIQSQEMEGAKDSKNPNESNNKSHETEVISDHSEVPDNNGNIEQGGNELRKRQQFEIIDKFISFESSLVKRKLNIPDMKGVPQEDLSLKSSSLNDELVSENLALIMKNQGKTELAIDIYKKLIWKFPQKKAYFASLIEELKN
jgi:hypothetical protein